MSNAIGLGSVSGNVALDLMFWGCVVALAIALMFRAQR